MSAGVGSRGRWGIAALGLVAAVAAALIGYDRLGGSGSKPPIISRSALTAADHACSSRGAPPVPRAFGTSRRVIWIWMENQSYDSIIGSKQAPFTNRLAAGCGLAANYHNITHPSLPNYIAATSGSTHGISDDCDPNQCSRNVDSLFGQADAAGLTWAAYEESMPGTCGLRDASGSLPSGDYTAHHDAAAYYLPLRAQCGQRIVPLGTPGSGALAQALRADSLPAFSFISPNDCDNMHDCPISTGDVWLSRWVTTIVSSPAYRSGRTVLFITWDEGEKGGSNDCASNTTTSGCRVAMLVVSPSTPHGARSQTLFNHYSLLRTTERLLGIGTYLGRAGDPGTQDMGNAFRLG